MPQTFGQALRAIQGKRKNTNIARQAIGADADPDDIRDFANYFSRIARDGVRNVGLAQLRLIAKGLGFAKLSEFFLHIENGHAIAELPGANPPPADPAKVADDDALQFDSEERIAARTFSDLARELDKALRRIESLEADARARQTHRRLPAKTRPAATKRDPHARKHHAADVSRTKKKRRKIDHE